jgi:hypothetical protein
VVYLDPRTKDRFYINNVVRLIFVTEDHSSFCGTGKIFKHIFTLVVVFKGSGTAVI